MLPVWLLLVLTLLLVVAGIALAWLRYWREEVPAVAPRGSLATRAARRDLYQDDVNEGAFMRPGIHLTRSLVFVDSRGVDGAVGGLAALVGGTSGRLAPRPERLRPFLCPDDAPGRRRDPRCRLGDAVMTSFPWLTTIGLIPLVGAAVVALLPASRRRQGQAHRARLLGA